MSGWDTLYCHFHPDRVALERCEVCKKPLCAYCLYYTEDGQRLCLDHAEQARQLGIQVEQPEQYADQLIQAQVGASRKSDRERFRDDDGLYHGNSTDLTAFIALLVGVISLGACCGMVYCLPLVGVGLSLVALLNAKKAFDPKRTRRLGVLGLLASGALVLLIAGCIVLYGLSLSSMVRVVPLSSFSVWTPNPLYVTDTPSPVPTAGPSETPPLDTPSSLASSPTPVP